MQTKSLVLAALREVVANDLAIFDRLQEFPMDEKRETLKMFYQTLLTGMGREREIRLFESAIKSMPQREIEKELEAIMDGTVTKIVKTLVKDNLTEDEKQELGAIWNGLADGYINGYRGDVPEEDLDWAHNLIKDFFDKKAELPTTDVKALED